MSLNGIDDALVLAPPLVVSGATLLGFTLHEWVYICTILYTVFGILTLIKNHWVDPYIQYRKAKERLKKDKENNGKHKE